MALKALGIDGQALRAGGGGQPADLVERYCAKLQLPYGAIAATKHVAAAVQEQAIGTVPLFFLGHISPIFAPFFAVFSRFSPS